MFAIESGIAEAIQSASQLALGSFILYVGGQAFGVAHPRASMLGCSFSEVGRRLQQRGTHRFASLADIMAADLATAYLDAFYRDTPRTDYFGLTRQQFSEELHLSKAVWAPDGDAAFDDGSHVLQFDEGPRVRLIAFVNQEPLYGSADVIHEEWVDIDLFYAVLSCWKTLFTLERASRLAAMAAE